MSGIFNLDWPDFPDRDYETWNPTRGAMLWAVEVCADRVRDEWLAGSLREIVDGGYGYFGLGFFTQQQAAEIVRVIRTDLKAATEAVQPIAEPRNALIHVMVDELIGMADRWVKA
ncbi:hypothetical protein [Lentzea sp. NPDC003310]|uniref:hypothetical protein n=1 Tax=Lentzea sp. NPDC003310 TaxID=3154447 RepID=UPI0033A3F31A